MWRLLVLVLMVPGLVLAQDQMVMRDYRRCNDKQFTDIEKQAAKYRERSDAGVATWDERLKLFSRFDKCYRPVTARDLGMQPDQDYNSGYSFNKPSDTDTLNDLIKAEQSAKAQKEQTEQLKAINKNLEHLAWEQRQERWDREDMMQRQLEATKP